MSLNCLKVKDKNSLLELLQKYEKIAYGTLGKNTSSDYTARPYHAKPFPISNIHEPTRKKKDDRLIYTGVLKKINDFKCVSPTFIIHKINGIARFISAFRE